MSNDAAYDISDDLDAVSKVDEVTNALEERRKKKKEEERRKQAMSSSSEETDRKRREKEAAAEKRKRQAARRKEDEEKRAREERERVTQRERWITPSVKVRESRTKALERIFFLLKAAGRFTGTKQEFYDEGLAYLEQKYRGQADD